MRSCIALCASFLCLAALCACASPQPVMQGQSGIEATYYRGVLNAVLPESARAPAVIAATEQVARARGYSIVSSASTDELSTIVIRPPQTSSIPTVRITARRVMQGTQVQVENNPWGDEDLSRSLLDAILQRLGL